MAEKIDYNSLPEGNKNQWGKIECPNCESRKFTISEEETSQGIKDICTCNNCTLQFRRPKD